MVAYNAHESWGWLDTCKKETLNQIEVIPGDVRDLCSVKHAMRDVDVVFHLAALVGVPYSFLAPESYVMTNVQGTLNVLQAAREFDLQKIIHTSSSEVYGTAKYIPIDEEHPQLAQSPYAASKIAADQLALSYHQAFQSPVALIRLFNTYGPRQTARAVIPTVINQILTGQEKLSIGALAPTRDFCFVHDSVSGLIAGARAADSIGTAINIGSGFEISIQDLIALVKRLMNSDIQVDVDDCRMRPGKSEVMQLKADIGKAKRLLDWSPKYTGVQGLEEGLRQTIDWFRSEHKPVSHKVGTYTL